MRGRRSSRSKPDSQRHVCRANQSKSAQSKETRKARACMQAGIPERIAVGLSFEASPTHRLSCEAAWAACGGTLGGGAARTPGDVNKVVAATNDLDIGRRRRVFPCHAPASLVLLRSMAPQQEHMPDMDGRTPQQNKAPAPNPQLKSTCKMGLEGPSPMERNGRGALGARRTPRETYPLEIEGAAQCTNTVASDGAAVPAL